MAVTSQPGLIGARVKRAEDPRFLRGETVASVQELDPHVPEPAIDAGAVDDLPRDEEPLVGEALLTPAWGSRLSRAPPYWRAVPWPFPGSKIPRQELLSEPAGRSSRESARDLPPRGAETSALRTFSPH